MALPSAEKKLVIVPTDRVCCGYGVKTIEMQPCSRCKGDMQRACPFAGWLLVRGFTLFFMHLNQASKMLMRIFVPMSARRRHRQH